VVTSALLDATAGLLSTHGVRRWSVEDVAERSGLGRTTVYRRFECRDDLVHAVLARDVRQFFAAIAADVGRYEGIEDKLVEGFVVGLRAVRRSLIPRLVQTDTADALALLTADPVLQVGRRAMVDQYLALEPEGDEGTAELVAEAIVRLAMSFVLAPQSVIDLEHDDHARRAIRRLIGPLVKPPA
jgi:AcrR family transcriptional regulator